MQDRITNREFKISEIKKILTEKLQKLLEILTIPSVGNIHQFIETQVQDILEKDPSQISPLEGKTVYLKITSLLGVNTDKINELMQDMVQYSHLLESLLETIVRNHSDYHKAIQEELNFPQKTDAILFIKLFYILFKGYQEFEPSQ